MRLLFLSLALLLLASAVCLSSASSSPWQSLPEGDLLAELKLDLGKGTAKAMSLISSLGLAPSRRSPNEDECCQCTRSVGEHILSETFKVIDAVCQNTTCPVIKKRCEWIEGNKEEFTGYLVAKMRPMHDGYIYCMGNGTCEHPGAVASNGDSAEVLSASFSNNSSSSLLSQLSASVHFIQRGLASDFSPSTELIGRGDHDLPATSSIAREGLSKVALLSKHRDLDTDHNSAVVDGGSRSRCHRCLSHGVRWVMKRSVKHLKRACKDTKCPYFAKFCEWAKEHKKFVRGIIYEHVRPYKYAIGWCFGRRKCHKESAHADLTAFPFTMKGGAILGSEEESTPIIATQTKEARPANKERKDKVRKDKMKKRRHHRYGH